MSAPGDGTTATRDARISYTLAALCAATGLILLALGAYSSLPGSCGLPEGCPGGRDATPLTGIAVGSGLLGVAWGAWRKGRALAQPPTRS